MSGAHRATRRPREKRGRPLPVLILACAVLLLGATGGLGTFAYWNDVETVTGDEVTAGSLDLTVRDGNGVAVGSWSQLKLTAMAPGESVAAALTVKNGGSTPFTLTAVASGTGLLLPGIDVALIAGAAPVVTSSGYPRSQTCTGAEDKPLSSSPSWTLGTLAPDDVRQICVRLSLRLAAENGLQGKPVTPTFVFTASQVQP